MGSGFVLRLKLSELVDYIQLGHNIFYREFLSCTQIDAILFIVMAKLIFIQCQATVNE